MNAPQFFTPSAECVAGKPPLAFGGRVLIVWGYLFIVASVASVSLSYPSAEREARRVQEELAALRRREDLPPDPMATREAAARAQEAVLRVGWIGGLVCASVAFTAFAVGYSLRKTWSP